MHFQSSERTSTQVQSPRSPAGYLASTFLKAVIAIRQSLLGALCLGECASRNLQLEAEQQEASQKLQTSFHSPRKYGCQGTLRSCRPTSCCVVVSPAIFGWEGADIEQVARSIQEPI